MVYKDVPQHRTIIIQLLLNHVSADRRVILPRQDLFQNIAVSTKGCYIRQVRPLNNPGIQRQGNHTTDWNIYPDNGPVWTLKQVILIHLWHTAQDYMGTRRNANGIKYYDSSVPGSYSGLSGFIKNNKTSKNTKT